MKKEKDNFRKFDKVYRIPTPNIETIPGKHYHNKESIKELLSSIVEITEKTDGANVAVYKDPNGKTFFQKRGSHLDNDHEQYVFFNNWIKTYYQKIKGLPNNKVYYMELMRCKHSIYYDKLEDWAIMFKIWDLERKRFLSYIEMKAYCDTYKLTCSNLIYTGNIKNELELESYVPKKSKWGNMAEGIVVFNPEKNILGKIVKPEFKKLIDKFWRNKPTIHNQKFDKKLW